MRKLIIILLSIGCIVSQSIAGTCTKIEKCPICGAEMQVEYECTDSDLTFYGDNMPIYYGTGIIEWPPPKKIFPDAEKLQLEKDILICEDCYRKYSNFMREALSKKWDELFNKFIAENIENRKLNTVKAKERKLNEMREKLIEMQEQIKNLENK